jgi:hypothetical protein
MRLKPIALIALILCVGCASSVALGDEGCRDFKWDVSRERALFVGTATTIAAGADLKSAPTLVPNRLYQLQLMLLDQVSFVVAPGKKYHADGERAGVAALRLPAGGSYRIALDMPVWIDVAANGSLVPAKDFQGQHDCTAPHKIVEFDLAADQALILQLSGATGDSVRLTITPSPTRKF